MSILSLMQDPGPDIYYSDDFRRSIEDHIDYLKALPDTKLFTIEPMVAYKYVGDFYTLLNHLEIPMRYHWVTMRVNGLLSPQDYDGELLEILYPSPTAVKKINRLFTSQNKLRR